MKPRRVDDQIRGQAELFRLDDDMCDGTLRISGLGGRGYPASGVADCYVAHCLAGLQLDVCGAKWFADDRGRLTASVQESRTTVGEIARLGLRLMMSGLCLHDVLVRLRFKPEALLQL
jgi:hypothetical protein